MRQKDPKLMDNILDFIRDYYLEHSLMPSTMLASGENRHIEPGRNHQS